MRIYLHDIQKQILKDCTILFTRVIPKDIDPDSHPLWKMARKLGATCVEDIDERVTHIVASDATQKTKWGSDKGKFVVSPQWLWCAGMSF